MSQKNTNSSAQQEFHKFVRETSDKVISIYGGSYMTQAEVRNKWRNEIQYSADIEDFLVRNSKIFIRLMDRNSSNSTNPVFLKALVNLMADYLSAYTMHANGRTRNTAKKILKEALWDNNVYIQNMLAQQAQTKRERRHRSPKSVAKKRKADATAQAKKDFAVARDVRSEFMHVSTYRKYR